MLMGLQLRIFDGEREYLWGKGDIASEAYQRQDELNNEMSKYLKRDPAPAPRELWQFSAEQLTKHVPLHARRDLCNWDEVQLFQPNALVSGRRVSAASGWKLPKRLGNQMMTAQHRTKSEFKDTLHTAKRIVFHCIVYRLSGKTPSTAGLGHAQVC
jgi:hypothetical protein